MHMQSRKRPSFLPDDTTPITRRNSSPRILTSLLWLIAFPATALLAIWLYGLPALKFQYTYVGPKDTRIETECVYLSFDGPVRVVPALNQDRCPIIALFPTKLLGI